MTCFFRRIIDGKFYNNKIRYSINYLQRYNFFTKRLTCIFSFNKLAREFTLVTEFWLLIILWPSNSFAIISLLFSRNDGNGAMESRRFVRNWVLQIIVKIWSSYTNKHQKSKIPIIQFQIYWHNIIIFRRVHYVTDNFKSKKTCQCSSMLLRNWDAITWNLSWTEIIFSKKNIKRNNG